MSSPLAIAAVTAVLQKFLQNSVAKYGLDGILNGTVKVSAEAPDRILNGAASPDRINLFLFQATENQGWRNSELPTRNANGDRISNPPLALDLSYLLTAYGSADFHAEVLLGHAMSVFHEMPILTRDAIRAAIPVPPPTTLPNALTNADLADQIEQIKITPQPMSVEEVSKIWSALQSQYRPTAVYKATVVLIESVKAVRPSLPVRARNVLVVPFENPVIDLIQSQATITDPIAADQKILAGYNLVIDGRQLRGDTTRVLIDDEEIIPADDKITATRIIVPLPVNLQPGLHSVQVVHRINFLTGFPSEPHRGVESNVAAFVLSPLITTSPIPDTAHGSTLKLDIAPPVGRAQRVALLVGNSTIFIPARSAAGPDTTASLDFPIPANFAPTGTPLPLRVQIDGAESPLDVDGSGQFASPTITIT
jgi:Pvc16 N-terminal domain